MIKICAHCGEEKDIQALGSHVCTGCYSWGHREHPDCPVCNEEEGTE